MPEGSGPLARWGAEVRLRIGRSGTTGPAEASVVEELSQHVDDLYRDLVARGVPDDEARRLALADLDVANGDSWDLSRVVPSASYPVAPPIGYRGSWWSGLLGDTRYAIRVLMRERAFTAVAVLTLAVGVGAVSTMFSLVHGLLLRPLPYPDGDRLASVVAPGMISPANLQEWREGAPSLERLAGFGLSAGVLEAPGHARRLRIMVATNDLLPLLGAQPIAGRLWATDEASASEGRIAVISQQLWTEVLRGAQPLPDALTVDGISYSVLGVLPDDFHNLGYDVDLWVPVAQRASASMTGVARLRPGATLADAALELSAVAGRVEALPIAEDFGRTVRIHSLRELFAGDARATLLILLAAAGCVLLLACANLANLLLSRAAGRGRELAIRSALGAGRGVLLRQLVVELAVLAAAGGVAGLVLAWWMVLGLVPLLPPGFTRLPLEFARIDGVVLAVAMSVALATMLFAGVAAAFASMRSAAPVAVMTRATPTRWTRRWREVLIAAETAVAVILLTGTTLLVQTYLSLRPASPGYDPRDRMVATLSLGDEPNRNAEFVRRLIREITLESPTSRAAVGNQVPLSGMVAAFRLAAIDGNTVTVLSGQRAPSLDVNPISPEYIDVLGMRVIQGRPFDERDMRGAQPVMIINRTAAARFWPQLDSPLGRRLAVELPQGRTEFVVIGMIEDVRTSGLSTTSRSQAFVPYDQVPLAGVRVIVHQLAGGSFDATALRQAVARIDPTVPVGEVTTLAALASSAVATPRYQMVLMSGFGVLALLLAVIGCYGVLAYSVSQRTREFGLRMALGAGPAAIRRAVLGRAGLLVVGGLVLGGAGAVASTRVIESKLYGVVPAGPATFALVSVALVTVSMLAAYLPARRAAAVDPVIALRGE